jgi:hypothetical protein
MKKCLLHVTVCSHADHTSFFWQDQVDDTDGVPLKTVLAQFNGHINMLVSDLGLWTLKSTVELNYNNLMNWYDTVMGDNAIYDISSYDRFYEHFVSLHGEAARKHVERNLRFASPLARFLQRLESIQLRTCALLWVQPSLEMATSIATCTDDGVHVFVSKYSRLLDRITTNIIDKQKSLKCLREARTTFDATQYLSPVTNWSVSFLVRSVDIFSTIRTGQCDLFTFTVFVLLQMLINL